MSLSMGIMALPIGGGGGGSQNLEQVTTIGNTTDKGIKVFGNLPTTTPSVFILPDGSGNVSVLLDAGTGSYKLRNVGTTKVVIEIVQNGHTMLKQSDVQTADHTVLEPDADGIYQVSGNGLMLPISFPAKTGTYKALRTDYTIECDTSAANVTIQLDNTVLAIGQIINIKVVVLGHNVAITALNGKQIDNSAFAYTLSGTTNYNCVAVQWDGTKYWVFAGITSAASTPNLQAVTTVGRSTTAGIVIQGTGRQVTQEVNVVSGEVYIDWTGTGGGIQISTDSTSGFFILMTFNGHSGFLRPAAFTGTRNWTMPDLDGTLAIAPGAPVSKTANYSAAATDMLILCDTSGGTFTITLPGGGIPANKPYLIKRTDTSANALLINTTAGAQIDGAASVSLSGISKPCYQLIFDGTNYWIT